MTAIRVNISKISVLLLVLLLAVFYLLYSTPVHAQASTPSATLPSSTNLVPSSISPTSALYTDLLVHNLFHTASCLMAGYSIIGQPCLSYKISQDAQGFIKGVPFLSQTNLSGGALVTTGSLIDTLYLSRPVKTADYLAVLGEDLGIKEARAQVGGSAELILRPVLRLWQVSRNISYLFMILVFVIIGLMVMFRQRINPQTVVTAQAAIPGLVIGLILITFSYFLAALISDLAFLGTNLVGFYFSAASGGGIQTNLVGNLSGHNVLGIFSRFVGAIEMGQIIYALDIIYNAVDSNVKVALKVFAALAGFFAGSSIAGGIPIIGPILGLIAGLIGATVTTLATTQVLGFFAWLISIAILIYAMFRLLLRLISNYLTIIFLTVTAPFHFMAASLPGRQGLATDWVLNMLCNVLAFPAVVGVFYFVAFILGKPVVLRNETLMAINNSTSVTGTAAFPLFGGLDLGFINLLLAFGALLATPAIPEIICRIIGRMSVAGQLIGQEMGANMRGQRYWDEVAERGGRALGTAGQFGGSFYGEKGWVYIPGTGYVQIAQPSLAGRLGLFGKQGMVPIPTGRRILEKDLKADKP